MEFKKRVIVWGTGKYCVRKIESIENEYDVVAYVDSKKEQALFRGKKVLLPEMIRTVEWDYVMVLSSYWSDILQKLKILEIAPDSVLLGVNYKPYIGDERRYVATASDMLLVNEKYSVDYVDEEGKKWDICHWDDLKTNMKEKEKNIAGKIMNLPINPVERGQGALSGKSIKRYYTDAFIKKYRDCIQGTVVEMEDRRYTKAFGQADKIKESYIAAYHMEYPAGEQYGLEMDLSDANNVIRNKFDCFICTHTLSYILNVENAIDNLVNSLKHNGVVLLTFSGIIHRVPCLEEEEYEPCYGILPTTVTRILDKYGDEVEYTIETYGNIRCLVGTLYGVPSEYFSQDELMYKDVDYPIIIGVKIVRK